MNPDSTISDDEVIEIAENCIKAIYDHIGYHYGLTKEQTSDRQIMEKYFYEYGKGVPFLAAILTEKGIAALRTYDAALAYRMFTDAVLIDTPSKDYWQQYGYLALIQLNPVYDAYDEAKAKETIQKLASKHPSYKADLKKLADRMPDALSSEQYAKLEIT